jgi:DNA-binding response OmpR family regulator
VKEEQAGKDVHGAEPVEQGLVLVIDDEEIVRRTAASMLSKLRWRALTARDGSGGVETLRGRPGAVDAVFLDHALPDGETLVTMEAIRELDPRVPVVLLGGRGRREEALATRNAAAFLGKPFDYHELSGLMAALVRKREPSRP